jgi:hypothetical protein
MNSKIQKEGSKTVICSSAKGRLVSLFSTLYLQREKKNVILQKSMNSKIEYEQ